MQFSNVAVSDVKLSLYQIISLDMQGSCVHIYVLTMIRECKGQADIKQTQFFGKSVKVRLT